MPFMNVRQEVVRPLTSVTCEVFVFPQAENRTDGLTGADIIESTPVKGATIGNHRILITLPI